jgi:hypothetical protein
MSMFGPKLGTWWVRSEKDPRWNKTGQGYGLVCSGGPGDLHDWVKECREKYGDPPDDAEQGFMKD